eukprot:scaffold109422_cov21-Tisochrysis_lutea.AAC.1
MIRLVPVSWAVGGWAAALRKKSAVIGFVGEVLTRAQVPLTAHAVIGDVETRNVGGLNLSRQWQRLGESGAFASGDGDGG